VKGRTASQKHIVEPKTTIRRVGLQLIRIWPEKQAEKVAWRHIAAEQRIVGRQKKRGQQEARAAQRVVVVDGRARIAPLSSRRQPKVSSFLAGQTAVSI
jgi:hypothetical protein